MEDALIRRIALATIALALLGLLGFFLLAWRPAIAPIEPPKLTLVIDAGTIIHPIQTAPRPRLKERSSGD